MNKDIIEKLVSDREKWKSRKWENVVNPYTKNKITMNKIQYYIPATLEVTDFLNKNYQNRRRTIPDLVINNYTTDLVINNYTIYDDLTYKETFDYELLYMNIKELTLNDLKKRLRKKKMLNILEEKITSQKRIK